MYATPPTTLADMRQRMLLECDQNYTPDFIKCYKSLLYYCMEVNDKLFHHLMIFDYIYLSSNQFRSFFGMKNITK